MIMGKKMVAIICLFAAIVAVAVAGPIELRSGSCARQCTESNKFQYSNGKSYNYDYEMETVTTLEGTTNEASRLHMKCTVELHVVSPCEMVMKLSGVTLEQSSKDSPRVRLQADQEGTFRRSLESNPLRFSFQDGAIEHVCPTPEETVEALNIKRGILSALQTNMETLEGNEKVLESDVSGKCTTLYEALPKGWKTQTIRKTKDLSSCTQDYDEIASKSQPLVKGSQECTQTFSNQRLQKVECSESHLLRAFSRHQKNGAVTRVKSTLTFNKEGTNRGFTGNGRFHERRHLSYDHSEEKELEQARLSSKAEEALSQLCEASKNDIRPNVPALFTALVHRMKPLQHSELVNLQQRVSMICGENPRGNRMFLDAVAMCGSTGAARMMAGLIEEGKVSNIDVELWLESLAFVKNPDREMLSSVTPLLNRKENFLAVSALVNTYCKKYSDCHELGEIRQIAKKMSNALSNGCSGSNKDDMMMALKAMGNMGPDSETEDIVRKCFDNTKIDTEIRVAAIQAFRRADCSKAPMTAFTTMFRNINENVEIRISSFLAMMKCPSFNVFSDVRDVLRDERINQVGSFVWSYIRNAAKKEKSNPEFNNLLSDRTLVNKFKTDAMKFSRSYGSSFFLESMDIGASADGQVIFTPEGYLPRSALLNLTVDILGSSMNIMELEGRAEGVERLVESLFGPDGYFKNSKSGNEKNSGKTKEESAIEVMGNKYNVKSRFDREPTASLDMKVFGNSLMYERFGMNKDSENSVSGSYFETMSLPDILAELAKERDISFNKNIMLFDHSFSFPTGTGFPLRLNLEGSASVALVINGKMDMRSMDNIDVRGKIQPSGAIEMAAIMSVHASKEISSGLKITATLHSSTFVDGLVEVRSGRIVRSQINVPRDNIELFDLQTRILLVRNEDLEAPALFSGNEVKNNMLCYGSQITGMELCGQIHMPTIRNNMPNFPLSGMASFKAIMRKTDPTLTHYNMELRWNPDGEGKTEGILKFNTPGSSIERELSTGFTLNQEDQTFNLWARYPNQRININGKRVNTEVDKRLNFGVSVNDIEKFSVDAVLGMEGFGKNGIRYIPSFAVRGPNSNKMFTLRGQVNIRDGLKYGGEVTLEDIVQTPITLKGDISVGDRKEIKMSISSSQIETSFTGYMNKRTSEYTVKANLEYRLFNARRQKLDLSGKLQDLSASSLISYAGTASIHNSAFPEYSTAVQIKTQITDGQIDNTLELMVGQKRNAHRITVQEILKWEGSLPENKVEATLKFQYPEKYIDYLFKFEHQNTMTSTNDKVTIRYAPERDVVATFGGSMNGNPMNANANFQLDSTYSGRICNFECALKQQGEGREYELTFAATQKKNKLRGLVSIADRSDSTSNSYFFKTELALPSSRKPMTATGDLSFANGRYTVNGEMDMGGGSYGGKMEYTATSKLSHRFSTIFRTPSQSYSAEGSMEGSRDAIAFKANVQGDRRINMNINLRNTETVKTCSVNLLWDADRDTNKRFALESQVKCMDNKHHGEITVAYPGRTISGSFDGSMEGELSRRMKVNGNVEFEWQPGYKIRMDMNGNTMKRDSGMNVAGDIKMKTPFKGAENMALSIQHNVTPKEIRNEITTEWQRNKVSFVTECKHQIDDSNLVVDITTRLTTTFRNYESMIGQALFKLTPNDVITTVAARWPNNVFEISASGNKEPMAAMVNITTPFASLSQASASVSYDYQPKKNIYKIDSDVTWNGRNQINVALEGRSNMVSNRKRSCFAGITVTSTVPGYEKLSSRATYNYVDREFKLESDSAWNKERITFGYNSAYKINRNTKYVSDIESRIYYTSTLKNFRNGEGKVTFHVDDDKLNTGLSVKLPYDASMNVVLEIMQASDAAKELKFSANSNNFWHRSPAALSFVIRYAEQKLTSNAQLIIGESVYKSDLMGYATFGRDSHDIDTKLTITSQDLSEFKLSFTNQRRSMQFTTQGSASTSIGEFRVFHVMKFNGIMDFETKLTMNTPYRKYKSIEMNINNAKPGAILTHKSDFVVSGKKVMELVGEFGVEQKQRSSFDYICKLDAQLPFTQNKFMIDARHSMNSERMIHRPKINLEWSETGRLAFVGNFAPMEDSPVIEGRLSSSITNLEALGFVARYTDENKQKCGQGSLRWAADKEMTWRGCLDVQNNNIELTATTPFNGFETASLRGDINKANSEKSANLAIEYGRNRITLNGKYSSKRRGSEMSFQYTTPFSGWTSGTFGASYMGKTNDFTMDVSGDWAPGNKLSFNLVHKFVNGRLNTRVVVLTSFRGYKTMSAGIATDFESPKKTASFVAELEKKAIRTNMMVENDFPRSLVASFDIISPFMDDIRFSGDFKKTAGNCNILTTVQWGQNQNLRTNVVFDSDIPNSLMCTLDMSSTINGMESIKLNGQYKKTNSGCNVVTAFEWGTTGNLRTKMVFENEYPRSILSTFELTSSLKGFENIKLNGNYKGEKNFNVMGSLQWGQDSIRTGLELENKYPRSMMTRFHFTSSNGNAIRLNGDYNKTPAGCEITTAFEFGRENMRSKFVLENQLPNALTSEFEIASSLENFEQIKLMGSYVKSANGPRLTTSCKWASDKQINAEMSFENELPRSLSGKFLMTSPFKELESIEMNGNYEKTSNGGNVVAMYRWGRNTVRISTVHDIDYPRSMMGTFELSSPYRGYENVKLNADFKNTDRGIEAVFGWGENKAIRTTMKLENKFPKIVKCNFELRTPFENFEEITFDGDLRKTKTGANFQTSLKYALNKMMTMTAQLNDQEASVFINTPFRPFQNLRFTGTLGNDNLRLTCEWEEPAKKIDLNMRLVKSDNQLEGSVELTTPFKNFKKASVSTELSRYDREWRHTKGNLKISTPFEILRNFEMEGQAKLFPANYEVELSIVPSERSNRVAASGFARSMNGLSEFQITVDKYSVSANFKGDGAGNMDAAFRLNGNEEHSAALSYKNVESGLYNIEVKMFSPAFYSNEMRAAFNMDIRDSRRMNAEATVDLARDTHKISGTAKVVKHGFDFDFKANSPMIPAQEMSTSMSFSNKRNKAINGQVSLNFNAKSHAAEFSFDRNNGRDTTAFTEIRCPFISDNPVRFEGKFIKQENSDSVEITLAAVLPNGRHACTLGYNRNDSPASTEVSFVLDSPMLEAKTISVSGKISLPTENSLEGTLTTSGIGNGDSRLAINLRRDSYKTFEGFMTVNLPAGPLRVFRADVKMNTDGSPRNADLVIDIQTSVRNFKRFTTTLKTKTSANTWDLSANMRLPMKGMENIGILATIHQNEMMTHVTPRITVSLPSNKYVLFGNMEKEGSDMLLALGYEINDEKVEGMFELKGEELRLMLTTPFRNYEKYSLVCSMRDEKAKRTVRIVFEDPMNKKYIAQVSGMYNGLMNFNFEMELKTPFEVLLDNNIRFRQQYRRGRFVSSFQHMCMNKRKNSFSLDHQFSSAGINGNIEVLTPFETLSTSKLTYSYASSSGNTKLNVQSEMNSRPMLQVEMNGDNEEKRFTISFPAMPYTLMGSVKTGSTLEYRITSISTGRTMGFTSMYQNNDKQTSHAAKLTWDEKENSVLSYEWRSAARRTGGSEMYGRLNFPARSFEMKAEHEPTGNGRNVKCDFAWDAARNPSKQLTVALQHTDNSGYRSIGHQVQFTVAYPEMNKEIIAKTEFNWTPKQVQAKAELEFSRNSQQNIVIELSGEDLSKSRKDSNYQVVLAGRHPASQIDIKLVGDVINNAQEASSGLKMNFLGNDRRERIHELRAKIQKLKQNMELLARCNDNTVVMNGRYFNRDRMMTFELDCNVNSEKVAEGSLSWNGRERKVECNLKNRNEGIKLHGSVLPDNVIQMEISHSNPNEVKVSDARLHLSVKENSLLESRLNWRPEVFDEAYNRINMAYESGMNKVNKMVEDSRRQTQYEYVNAIDRAQRTISPEFSYLKNSISTEMDRLGEDYNRMQRKLNHMYRRNEFYMQTITEASAGTVGYMMDMGVWAARSFSNMMRRFNIVVSNACCAVVDGIVYTVEGISNMFVNLERRFARAFNSYKLMLDDMILDMIAYCIELSFDFAEYYDGHITSLANKLDSMFNGLFTRFAPLFRNIREGSAKILSKIAFIIEEYSGNMCNSQACQYAAGLFKDFNEYLSQITYDGVCKAFNNYGQSVLYVIEHATEYMSTAYNYVQDNSHLVAINAAVGKTFNKVRDVAYHLGLDTLTFNLMEEIYSKSMQALWSALQVASQDIYNMRNDVRYTYEPESGRLEVEMGIPNTKFTPEDLISITQNPDFQRLWEMKEKLFNFDTNSIWDAYYQYKRYMDPYYWIPPFNGRAMLAGNQHFVTFDNFHFDYAGECSFLVARDFVDGNFSVSVTYVQDENLRAVRKSMVVFSNGKKVEINNDHKVTINDAQVELPQELTPGGVSIFWIEGTIVVADEQRGMTLKCNFEHDLCTLDVSGFYFAKTGGLFGTFNYEPHMDMTTRDNQITDNVEEFATSWKLGSSSCKTSNKAVSTSNDMRANERCKELFESNDSPLRPCFKLLSPEPFMRMCLNDLSAVRESEQSFKTCTAIGAYIEKCRMEGVEMRMLKHCVRCERHDGQWMEGGDIMKITNSPSPSQATDIVFIVEEKPCNNGMPQMLKKLATALEEQLRKEGFRKIRFSVVGFGGEGIHKAPHVVTTHGRAFGTARTISTTALENLSLSKNGEDGNVFMALRYAAGLPFLAGATKNFIVAKCSACQVQEMKCLRFQADYSEMLRTMLDGEINLHMIMDLKLETYSQSKLKKARAVVGFDKNYAFTVKDMKDDKLAGDSSLLAALRVPKDLCVPLALEINGSVFLSNKLVDAKNNLNKKTLEIFSKRILTNALPSECQLCECLATSSGLGKSICQRCVSPVVASMVSDAPMYEYFGKNNEFNNDLGDKEEEPVTTKPRTKPMKPRPKRRN